MRQAHLRTLATKGIEVVRPLRIPGLEVYEAIDENGTRVLIFSGGVFGPSWVAAGFALEQSGFKHTLLGLGKNYFLSQDTAELRQLLNQVRQLSRISASQEIFIPDVGFLISDLPRKFDARTLIAPAVILSITVLVWLFQLSRPVAEMEIVEPAVAISCALDLTDAEYRDWFKDQYRNADIQGSELAIQTDLGLVAIEIEQALGSTQLVSARIQCQDGRSQSFEFRTDSQSGGDLIELGERLDP